MFRPISSIFAALVILGSLGVRAQDDSRASTGVIVPAKQELIQPSDYNQLRELTRFEPEWCAPNQVSPSAVSRVCFGRMSFHGLLGARALVFFHHEMGSLLYLESEPPKVELLKPEFKIIGPIRNVMEPSEFGRARVSIDRDGEVDAVVAIAGYVGEILAFRP